MHYLPLRQGWLPQENFDAPQKGENDNDIDELDAKALKVQQNNIDTTLFHFNEIKLLAKGLAHFGIGLTKSS